MNTQYAKRFMRLFYALHSTEDILAFIIRGHLYCEASLVELLRQSFKNPDAVNIDRLTFSLKVNLCSALGSLTPDLRSGLLQLNSLRNKIAHNLEYEVQESDQVDLINTLRSSLGEPGEYYFSRGVDFPNGLRRCIISLWIPLQLLQAENSQEVKETLVQIIYASCEISGMNENQFFEMCKKRLEEYYSEN